MKELIELQNDFQEYLLHASDAIQKNIISTEKISSEVRLAIYKNAYYSRLLETLETTWPILKNYLGEDAFEAMGYAYIHQYPSLYRSIRWFGDQLDIFLNEHSEYATLPHIAELAKFEWTMSLVFDAENAETVSLQDMGRIPPEQWESMRFKLHPSVYCLHLKWNTIAIWQALSNNEPPIEPEQSESPICWILWRKELTSHFCSVPFDEAWAIDALNAGKTFGEICEGLCQWQQEDDAPLHAASLLKGWISAGLIRKIYFS